MSFSITFFFSRLQTRGLKVNTILDILDGNQNLGVEAVYINPPEGDDSDGYDDSDTEEGKATALSRNILQVIIDFLTRLKWLNCCMHRRAQK
jgi:hypothetical protein